MDTITIHRRERIFQNSGNGMLQVWHLYLLPRGGFHKLSDDQVVKQYPFDLKAEATSAGYRISSHVYGDDKEQVVKDSVNITSMAITEYERAGLPLAVNFIPKIEVKSK